jgi:hypothetical protein
MHAITLSYSLSYAAAVKLGVGKSGTGQLDAGPVLAYLSDAERSWLAQHPKATFSLDDVVTDVVDLGDPARLARAVAMEVRSACVADDPVRLRSRIVGELVTALTDAKAGGHVSVYVSLPRRVSDGTSMLSGGIGVLADGDVGPSLLTELARYLDRCVAGLKRPDVYEIDKAPALLRAAYADGVAAYEDRVVRLALDAAKAGPLPCVWSSSAWARRRLAEGAVGVEVLADPKAPEGRDGRDGRVFRVCDYTGVVRDARLAGVIETSIRAVELLEAIDRERKGAHAACEVVLVAIGEAAICSVLDPEQVSRRALGALPDGELQQALVDDLVRRIERALGDSYSVGPLDEATVRWGELPRGGSDVARALDQLACVEEWGDASDLATGPLVAVRALALDGTEYLLAVEPT